MKIHHSPLGVGVFLSAIQSLIVSTLVLKDAFKGRDSTLNQRRPLQLPLMLKLEL